MASAEPPDSDETAPPGEDVEDVELTETAYNPEIIEENVSGELPPDAPRKS